MTLRLRAEVSLAEAEDGGGVLLDERSGEYWQLNPSGLTTLKLRLAGADEATIAETLLAGAQDGTGDVAQAVADIRELVAQLADAGLVVGG
ncbi:lasso peptide biosynthesis PqqD family chaperone [Saccharothrix obliqua]|uniref:lasso peptide biosynthesis PqqD family chaperone n=1 Tax=Saccharothrix obliqua TaxID=2861747 RepID=UPI001C5FA857|nr:lasso peptide biosynthesis PqqD family chaperone [Saccharothrix obliqua]MBW4718346.1 lasso peptide biosynthesis PqqD family chaperone [Saccharothrix obliqua]